MADIDIERKTPLGWLWVVVGAIVLGTLVFWLLAGPRRDRAALIGVPDAEMPIAGPAAVEPAGLDRIEEYRSTCAPREPGEMGLEHEYASNCMRLLLEAVNAAVPAERLTAVTAEAQSAREASQRLAASPPDAPEHAALARDGFTSLASLFERLRQQWYPAVAAEPVQELHEAARAIDPDELLLEQRDAVQRFFAQAGIVLGSIAEAA
jgi:hypothetical protein